MSTLLFLNLLKFYLIQCEKYQIFVVLKTAHAEVYKKHINWLNAVWQLTDSFPILLLKTFWSNVHTIFIKFYFLKMNFIYYSNETFTILFKPKLRFCSATTLISSTLSTPHNLISLSFNWFILIYAYVFICYFTLLTVRTHLLSQVIATSVIQSVCPFTYLNVKKIIV